jgi:endo-1,4-beta-xylanase
MHSSLTTVLVALSSLKTVLSLPHRPTGPRYLNDLAQDHGKLWFGTAADLPGTAEQTDNEYLRILTNPKNFGEITPANYMKVGLPQQQLE